MRAAGGFAFCPRFFPISGFLARSGFPVFLLDKSSLVSSQTSLSEATPDLPDGGLTGGWELGWDLVFWSLVFGYNLSTHCKSTKARGSWTRYESFQVYGVVVPWKWALFFFLESCCVKCSKSGKHILCCEQRKLGRAYSSAGKCHWHLSWSQLRSWKNMLFFIFVWWF